MTTARRRAGRPPKQRAATVHHQVLLVLRWMRHHAALADPAHDAHISIATAYRYLHEAWTLSLITPRTAVVLLHLTYDRTT